MSHAMTPHLPLADGDVYLRRFTIIYCRVTSGSTECRVYFCCTIVLKMPLSVLYVRFTLSTLCVNF